MNNIYKKYSVLSLLVTALCYSPVTNALTESPSWYDGTFDSVTVEFGDLEWLRWDQTLNMSINEALTTFESEGWRLATNIEMADLMNGYFPIDENTFNYGDASSDPTKVFDSDENKYYSSWDPATHPGYDAFESDFGLTDFYCDEEDICSTYASALFGSDLDGDSLYNRANVSYVYEPSNSYSEALTESDGYSADYMNSGWGVALVRNSGYNSHDMVTSVPEINAKGTSIAFALLCGLVFVYGESRRYKMNSQANQLDA